MYVLIRIQLNIQEVLFRYYYMRGKTFDLLKSMALNLLLLLAAKYNLFKKIIYCLIER